VTALVAARPAVHHASYAGDRTPMLGGIYGPNEFGELLTAVDVDYDQERDKSRVGFAFTTGPDIQAVIDPFADLEVSASAAKDIGQAFVAAHRVHKAGGAR
jgi:hypothetical protein